MVSVGVYAPLHIDDIAGCVGFDGAVPPVVRRLVVVDANAGIIATGAALSDWGSVEVRPRFYRLEDSAFRACIQGSLQQMISRQFTFGMSRKPC